MVTTIVVTSIRKREATGGNIGQFPRTDEAKKMQRDATGPPGPLKLRLFGGIII